MNKKALGIDTLLTIGAMLVSVIAFYFLGQIATNDKIASAKSDLSEDIGDLKVKQATNEANYLALKDVIERVDQNVTSLNNKLDKVIRTK